MHFKCFQFVNISSILLIIITLLQRYLVANLGNRSQCAFSLWEAEVLSTAETDDGSTHSPAVSERPQCLYSEVASPVRIVH